MVPTADVLSKSGLPKKAPLASPAKKTAEEEPPRGPEEAECPDSAQRLLDRFNPFNGGRRPPQPYALVAHDRRARCQTVRDEDEDA
jgi:hypothetical protein